MVCSHSAAHILPETDVLQYFTAGVQNQTGAFKRKHRERHTSADAFHLKTAWCSLKGQIRRSSRLPNSHTGKILYHVCTRILWPVQRVLLHNVHPRPVAICLPLIVFLAQSECPMLTQSICLLRPQPDEKKMHTITMLYSSQIRYIRCETFPARDWRVGC